MMIILIIMMISILMTITKTTSDVRDACSTADVIDCLLYVSSEQRKLPKDGSANWNFLNTAPYVLIDITQQFGVHAVWAHNLIMYTKEDKDTARGA